MLLGGNDDGGRRGDEDVIAEEVCLGQPLQPVVQLPGSSDTVRASGSFGRYFVRWGWRFIKKLEFFQIFYSSKKNFTQIFFNFFEEFWVLFRVLEKH